MSNSTLFDSSCYVLTDLDYICLGLFGDDVPVVELSNDSTYVDYNSPLPITSKLLKEINKTQKQLNYKNKKNQKQYKKQEKPKNIASVFESLPIEIVSLIMDDLEPVALDYFLRAFPQYREVFTDSKRMMASVAAKLFPWCDMDYSDMLGRYTDWAVFFYNTEDSQLNRIRKYRAYLEVTFGEELDPNFGPPSISTVPYYFNPIPTQFTARTFNKIRSNFEGFRVIFNEGYLAENLYDFVPIPLVPERALARAFGLKPQCGSSCLCPIRSTCTSNIVVDDIMNDSNETLARVSSSDTLVPERLSFREKGSQILKKTLEFFFKIYSPQNGRVLCPKTCRKIHIHKKFSDLVDLVQKAENLIVPNEPQSGRGFLSSFTPNVNLTHSVDDTVSTALSSLTEAISGLTSAIPTVETLDAAKQSLSKSFAPIGLVLPLVIVVLFGVYHYFKKADKMTIVAITAVASIMAVAVVEPRLKTSLMDLVTKLQSKASSDLQPQNGDALIESATSFLVLYLSYYISGEVPEGSRLRVLFTKILPDMKKMKDGVNFAGSEILTLVQTGVNYVRSEVLGLPTMSFFKTHKPEIDSWVESCSRLETMFANGGLKITISNNDTVRNLLNRGRALLAQNLDRKEAVQVRDVLHMWLRVLEKIASEFDQSGIRAATIRQEPTCLILAGGPGVGKTSQIKALERCIAARVLTDHELIDYQKNPDAYSYVENPSTGFKDGYTGQKIWLWDDAGQETDVAGNVDNSYFHFMQAKSIFPYKLHMASLTQKSNTYFTSTAMLLTTNCQDFKPNSITNAGALKRRFDISVVCVPKEEYCNPATRNGNLWARQLDASILKGEMLNSEHGGFRRDIYEYFEYDYFTLRLTGRSFDFDSLVEHFVSIYRNFERKHAQYVADLDRILQEQIALRPILPQAGPITDSVRSRIIRRAANTYLNNTMGLRGRLQGDINNQHVGNDEGVEDIRFSTDQRMSETEQDFDFNSLDLEDLISWSLNQEQSFVALPEVPQILILPPFGFDEALIHRFIDAYNALSDDERDDANNHYLETLRIGMQAAERFDAVVDFVNQITWKNFGVLLVKGMERGVDAFKSVVTFIGIKLSCVVEKGLTVKTDFDFVGFLKQARTKMEEAWHYAIEVYEAFERKYPNLVHVMKILSIGAAFLGPIMYFWNSCGTMEPQYGRNQRGNKKGRRLNTRAKAKMSTFGPDELGPQAGVDNGVAAFIEKCYSNSTYFMNYASYFDDENGMDSLIKQNGGIDAVMSEFGTILFVKETVAIMPYHFIAKLKQDLINGVTTIHDRMRLTRCTNFGTYYEVPLDCFLRAKRVTCHEGRDIVAVQFPHQVLHHPDITDRFVSTDYLQNHKHMTGILPVWRRGKMWCLSSHIKSIDNAKIRVDGVLEEWRALYEYYLNTRQGDCGAVLFLDDSSSGKQKILGIHSVGTGSYGCSAAISKEDIDIMIKDFAFVSVKEQLSDDVYTVQSVVAPAEAFIPLCKLPKPVFNSTETKIEPSVLHGTWGPAKKAPAQLKFFEKDGVRVDPLNVAAAKYGNSTKYVDPHLVKVSAEAYLAHLYAIDKNNVPEPRVLTFDESICGISGSEAMQPVNRHTSLGYPYVMNPVPGKPGKTRFFGSEGDIDKNSNGYKEYIRHIESVEADMKLGTYPNFWGIDCKKDEKRELEKVRIGKTRLFVTFNFDHAVLFGRHFGAFFDWFARMKIDNECAAGVNMYDAVHLERIANRFISMGRKSVFGDFSGFDTSMNTTVAWALYDIIELWYGDVGDKKLRRMLWLALVNSRHIIGDNLYQWDHGMPSGARFTMFINSMINSINIRAAYILIRGGKEYISQFVEHVKPIVMGDDNGLAIHPSMHSVLHQQAWTDAFAILGYKYTMEDKESDITSTLRDFTECSFLKRTMAFDVENDRWVARLALDSVLEPPYWTKRGTQSEQIVRDEVTVAFRELALYPESIYNEWTSKILDSCRRNMGWIPDVIDYRVNQKLVFSDDCYC